MKHRPPPRGSEERSSSSRIHRLEAQEFGAHCNHLGAMQASSNNRHAAPGNSNGPSPCQGSHAAREPGEAGDIRIQLGDAPEETGESSGPSQHPRLGAPGRPRGHSHSEGRAPQDGTSDLEEHSSSSFSEFRYLFQWLQKSFPYVVILSTKVLLQHITGISLGIGLLTTFMYANKSIVNQIFLRERRSKLQCAWILLFLMGSSLLLYYTFYSQSLHYSLVLLRPTVDFMNFWEVLWIVGVTDFILKFLFMGFKCVILLLPSFSMSFKAKGYWYMLLEELCQCYRRLVPVPVWFRYFVGTRELNSLFGWSFGVLLALLYVILKLLNFFGHLKNLRRVLWIFYTRPSYGVLASKRQCAEAGDICAICQAEFQKPTLLICQHIFCEECIALWFNRERTCPLCRTTISDHVDKWKDGATSAHLQVY